MTRRSDIRLAVLGGGSPGIPVLLQALEDTRRRGGLARIEVCLYGRDAIKLERIRHYVRAASIAWFRIGTSTRLDEALADATHVLSMIRPGGMEGRARDESLAIRAGVPADEGIGAGGLACFLRGRRLMRVVAERCSTKAPHALFLQMTSPLGLNVAIARSALGSRACGVCELPIVTAAAVSHEMAKAGFPGPVVSRCLGLNHQSWLYSFRNKAGADVTDAVLRSIDTSQLLQIDADVVQRHGAVPMPYLRLYFHTDRVLRAQREQRSTRGKQLSIWSSHLQEAYCLGSAPDSAAIARLLNERRMDWFQEAVVPIIEASLDEEPRVLPLNVPVESAVEGIDPQVIVEIDCEISSGGIRPLPAPQLPPLPRKLTWRLIDFERAALQLPECPRPARIAEVLALHPLTPPESVAGLAEELAGVQLEEAVLH
jgi:6-phospho-beta-glucosidase